DLPRLLRVFARIAGLAIAEQWTALRLHPTGLLRGPEAHGVAAAATAQPSCGRERIALVDLVLLIAAVVNGRPVDGTVVRLAPAGLEDLLDDHDRRVDAAIELTTHALEHARTRALYPRPRARVVVGH